MVLLALLEGLHLVDDLLGMLCLVLVHARVPSLASTVARAYTHTRTYSGVRGSF